jgi:hypothetical protein
MEQSLMAIFEIGSCRCHKQLRHHCWAEGAVRFREASPGNGRPVFQRASLRD